MPRDYLHNHPQFADLIRIVAEEQGIDPALVEKDYWIMHCLYGLQLLKLKFELKGGTSLSKGFKIIDRFSEDIDIRIEPPPGQDVKTGPNQTSAAQTKMRRDFYEWLAQTIKIDGVTEVKRDTAFDNKDLFSAGIRLSYESTTEPIEDLRDSVLLEAGFAKVMRHSRGGWIAMGDRGRRCLVSCLRSRRLRNCCRVTSAGSRQCETCSRMEATPY